MNLSFEWLRAWPSILGSAALALFGLMSPASAVAEPSLPLRPADTVLAGKITRTDFQTYRRIPFIVPRGVDRIVVAFDFDGRDQRTVIDLGVEDPHGLRGASGGNKSSFTISRTDATPSYLPGPVVPGKWQLMLAIPNIRPSVTTHWKARIWFLNGAEAETLPVPTAGRGPGWYRGDLHAHSAHSDGSCPSQSGQIVPCPVFLSLEAAAAAKLDYIALTEHNTASQAQALREAQPYFDRMLLIPGREITTFFGHFNVFGVTAPLDYRIMPGGPIGFNGIADRVHALGGLVSINHPALPSGEICMGCGWTMPGVDYAKVDAVEVVNGSSVGATGGNAESAVSGTKFWLSQLREGHAVVALGGSDNHRPGQIGLGAIGSPVTVVFAEDLTQPAILAGLRSGRAFVVLDPSMSSLHIDFAVRSGPHSASMGGQIEFASAMSVEVLPDISGPVGATCEVVVDEHVVEQITLTGAVAAPVPLAALPKGLHLVRLQLRGATGRIIALGNAVRLVVR